MEKKLTKQDMILLSKCFQIRVQYPSAKFSETHCKIFLSGVKHSPFEVSDITEEALEELVEMFREAKQVAHAANVIFAARKTKSTVPCGNGHGYDEFDGAP